MKFLCSLSVVYLFIKIDPSVSQRRIVGGHEVQADKKFMAYLLKSHHSPQAYDAWLCGGAIISEWFILSSAACVEDIKYMYAIVGYKYYKNQKFLDSDKCIRVAKKKVTLTCVPKEYDFNYTRADKWAYIDIALVRVESRIEFNKKISECSWAPNKINFNSYIEIEKANTNVIAYGWGHTEAWRSEDNKDDLNSEVLMFAPTKILSKVKCKKDYEKLPELHAGIEKYMICTQGEGIINDTGLIRNELLIQKDTNGCAPMCTPKGRLRTPNNPFFRPSNYYHFRKRFHDRYTDLRDSSLSQQIGICQNDHGGPLVTYIGAEEILIGVASVFLVDSGTNKCVGPFLYTSTRCNSAFINCVLTDAQNLRNDTESHNLLRSFDRRICKMPPEKRGFDMIQRRISWINHPDGPAENELEYLEEDLLERSQIPIGKYQRKSGDPETNNVTVEAKLRRN